MNKSRKISRKTIISLLTGTMLLAGLPVFYFQSEGKSEKLPEITTLAVGRDSIITSVATTGKISANLEVEIKGKASGEIMSLPFEVSDKVKKGDLLLKLNPVDEQQSVKQAEMMLVQSQASLAKAKQDLVITRNDLENSRKLAQASLEAALLKERDLQAKIKFAKNLTATSNNTALANIESVKLNERDLLNKAEQSKSLYDRGIISRNEYENALVAAQQAAIELKNAETRLREQSTVKSNDYDSAVASASQAAIEVQNARIRVKEQGDAILSLKQKEQDIRSLEARVESDRASLSNAIQRLNDTQIFSPIDGVITDRAVQEGQIISSGISSANGGSPVMTIADMSRMFIMASVDESDIGKIKLGQESLITVDAFPGEKFKGKVVQIHTKGTNTSNVVTFPVKVEISGENKKLLKPEMTANLEIFTNKRENVLVIDNSSVTRKNKKYFVSVMNKSDQQEEREVKVGLSDDEKYEIISGLVEGEKVVAGKSENSNPWKRDNNRQGRGMPGGMMMGGGRR